jgi:hypothetical protein
VGKKESRWGSTLPLGPLPALCSPQLLHMTWTGSWGALSQGGPVPRSLALLSFWLKSQPSQSAHGINVEAEIRDLKRREERREGQGDLRDQCSAQWMEPHGMGLRATVSLSFYRGALGERPTNLRKRFGKDSGAIEMQGLVVGTLTVPPAWPQITPNNPHSSRSSGGNVRERTCSTGCFGFPPASSEHSQPRAALRPSPICLPEVLALGAPLVGLSTPIP